MKRLACIQGDGIIGLFWGYIIKALLSSPLEFLFISRCVDYYSKHILQTTHKYGQLNFKTYGNDATLYQISLTLVSLILFT